MKNALILATLTALISIAIGTSSTAHADGTTPPAAAFHSGPQPGHEPASGRASGAAAAMSAGTVVSGASVVNAERPAVCGEPCAQFGTVSFEHPTWGTSKLIVEGAADGLGICFFTVVDAAGTPRWEKTGVACTNGNGSVFTPAPDKAGNILIQYGTMRYSGVTVLRPVTDGIDDFGSLPSDGSDPNTDTDRFANSVAYDVDGDGTFEIVSVGNSCEPDCASGTSYFRTYRWTGEDFVAELCALESWPQVPIQATPTAGGTVVGNIPPGACEVDTSGVYEWDGDRSWLAVSYGDSVGWAPDDAFAPPPTAPPWPESYDPWEQETIPPPPPPPPPTTSPPNCASYSFNDQYPIRRCDEGYAVYIIQQALVSHGYTVDVDGYFGPGTEQAVRDFQRNEGLEVDGLVGPNTWSTLGGARLDGTSTVTESSTPTKSSGTSPAGRSHVLVATTCSRTADHDRPQFTSYLGPTKAHQPPTGTQ